MAFYSTTLAQLVEQVLLSVIGGDNWLSGTITGSPTTAQIIDSSRGETDDYFQSTIPVSVARIMTTTDGLAPVGQERRLTDWAQSTYTGTVSPVFTVAPAAGDTYAIFREYSWAEVKAAINNAIDAVAKRALVGRIDETLEFATDTYEYVLPVGFTHVYRVSMEDGNGDYPVPIPPDQYKILRTSVPRIHFLRTDNTFNAENWFSGDLFGDGLITDGRHMRIEGLGRQARLSGDNDLCYVNPSFIAYFAGMILHASRIRGSANDPDEHRIQYGVCRQFVEDIGGKSPDFMKLKPILPPNVKALEV